MITNYSQEYYQLSPAMFQQMRTENMKNESVWQVEMKSVGCVPLTVFNIIQIIRRVTLDDNIFTSNTRKYFVKEIKKNLIFDLTSFVI